MSYLLHVWEGPEPVNRDNVAQVVEWLRYDKSAPNPKLIEFAKQLMRRYPHDAGDGAGYGVWSDGVIDGRSETPVFSFGVASPLPSVLRFVAETAMILGLHVHDAQTGRTWFASGSVHPPYSAADLAQQKGAERMTYPELKRSINEALYRILEKDGFFLEKGGTRLVRKIAGGTQGAHLTVVNRETEWECSLGFHWDFDTVEDIQYRLFDQDDPAIRASRHTGWLSVTELAGGKRFRVTTAQDVRRAIVEMQAVIVQQVLPLLDARTSLREFVEAYLGPAAPPLDLADHALAIRLLIAARLARSPRFGALALQLAQGWKTQGEQIRANLMRLLQYLRGVDPEQVVLPERVGTPAATAQAFGTSFQVDVDQGENTTFGILGHAFRKA